MTKFSMTYARALALVAVSLLAAGAASAGPYDQPFGIQWNRILEGVGNGGDAGGEVSIAPDDTPWTGARSGDQTFGPFNGGSSVQGGVGNWSPLGVLTTGRMATRDGVAPFDSRH